MISRFATSKLKKEDMTGELKSELSHLANTYYNSYKPSRDSLKKHGTLKKLKNNKDIVITKPDKGNGVVIMDRKSYIEKMLNILSDPSKFRKLDVDPTLKREGQLQRFLRTLKGSKFINSSDYEKIYPKGSKCARMYGLPKLHKVFSRLDVPPCRPVVSSIGTYNYQLAKFLSGILTPLIPNNHCAKDTFTVIDDLKKVSSSNKFMISFDVVSLFTNIPLDETIELAVNVILEKVKGFDISRSNLKKLFIFATKQTHFRFNEVLYDQVDGVAMGSPLAPAFANLFLGIHENNWLKDQSASKVLFYQRYVDDIFCLFEKEEDFSTFFDFINQQHNNIRFTFEKESSGSIAFLDVLIKCTETSFETTTFYKKTYTGLLTNFFSFTPDCYKVGLVRTLVDRAYKINSSYVLFHENLLAIKKNLQKNGFPLFFIDKYIKQYIDRKYSPQIEEKTPEPRFYKLPYIGKYSTEVKQKLNKIIKKCCSDDTNIRLIFTPFKIGSCFSLKDKPVFAQKSSVVYKFVCASCTASYIGETSRHISTRISEHLGKDKNSHVYKHLMSSQACQTSCDENCFSVLDHAETKYKLRIKEGLYIQWEKPLLNTQVINMNMTLLF